MKINRIEAIKAKTKELINEYNKHSLQIKI